MGIVLGTHKRGPTRGLGDLERRVIYFHGLGSKHTFLGFTGAGI